MAGKFSSIQEIIAEMRNANVNNAGGGRNDEMSMQLPMLPKMASSEKVELEELPVPARYFLDNLASRVLDYDNNFNVVTGVPYAGKSFFIEQLAYNIDKYLAATKQEKMFFIMLNDVNMIELGNTRNLTLMSQTLCHELQAKPNEVCLVTESPETALYISTVLPQHKLILEVNSDTFMTILYNSTRSTSKSWLSWNVLEVDNLECSRNELAKLLELTVQKRLNAKYHSTITDKQIKQFINYFLKKLEGNEHLHGKNKVIKTPPGVWATVLRGLMANYVYASHSSLFRRDGEINFTKVLEKTFYEFANYFEDFSGDNDQENGNFEYETDISKLEALGMPEDLLDLVKSGNARVFSARVGGGPQGMPGAKSNNGEAKPFEFSDVTTLESRLSESIIGQQDAVHRVASSFLVPAAGLNDTSKPVRSFLFLGPTGVGKTALTLELAKQVATEEMNVVRIDMSEYQQPHEVAKLFGAPPGYRGSEMGGILTNAVEENPNSVVLLDEIEKADPNVLDAFLQMLDAGHITDSMGNVVDFTNTIVIMTSNLGAMEASKNQLGFLSHGANSHDEKVKNTTNVVLKQLDTHLRAEFINRIDDIIVFQNITKETARSIALREINILAERMKEKGFTLEEPSNEVLDALLVKADIEKYGAREIQRVVFRNIAKPIAEQIVHTKEVETFTLAEHDNTISINAA